MPAWDNGFRLERGVEHGWLHYASTTAPGNAWIAGGSQRGPWLLSIDHAGVLAELGVLIAAPIGGPGIATFMFETLTQLHGALDRVYKLAVSLPDVPLGRFRAKTADLPRTTEAERLVIQRIGQDVFRDALMDYWGGRCPITGITDPALLRASHIVPWSECNDADERSPLLCLSDPKRFLDLVMIHDPRIRLDRLKVTRRHGDLRDPSVEEVACMTIRTKSVYSPIDRKNDGLRILATRVRGRALRASRYDVSDGKSCTQRCAA